MISLKPLPFEYNDFDPVISEEAMREHHLKHHQGYVTKTNDTLKNYPDLLNRVGGLYNLLANPRYIPREIKENIVNFGGGVFTHDFYWNSISPEVTEENIPQDFLSEIEQEFGGLSQLKKELVDTGMSHFGSGWVWLVSAPRLRVISTPNQVTPLMRGYLPLLCIDLWEHAYYLDYKSDKKEFLNNMTGFINWDNVSLRWNTIRESL